MSKITKYNVLEKFILRTPFLQIDTIKEVICSESSIYSMWTSCIDILDCIYVSSPELFSEFADLVQGKNFEERKKKKLLIAITKYLLRIGTKCTPFGFSSICSIGNISHGSGTNQIILNDSKSIILLDSSLVYKLVKKLQAIANFNLKVTYYLNNTTYINDSELNYFSQQLDDNNFKLTFNKLYGSEVIFKIMELSVNGIMLEELINQVNEIYKTESAYSLIDELVAKQFLISELEINLDTKDSLKKLLEVIDKVTTKCDKLKFIENIIKEIMSILLQLQSNYRIYLHEELYNKVCLLQLESSKKNLLYINKIGEIINGNLNLSIANEIRDSIDVITYFMTDFKSKRIQKFVEEFKNRYQDREMEITQVFDPYTGIGFMFGNLENNEDNFFNDLLFTDSYLQKMDSFSRNYTEIDKYLLELNLTALAEKKYEIELSLSDLKSKLVQNDKLARTFSVMVNIIYLEHGLVNNLIHVKDVSPFASRSLTRFSVLNEEIREFCEELSRIESNTSEDTIIAEIIHIPSLKHASIMQRDVSFNYNIPLVARQENKDQNEILCNDILVSVTNNRIVLRSKSLGKQIIPRLSSAFNYTLSDFPIFQFLCELQYQDISDGWNFNWGILEDQIGFRPRVKYKNVILSPASWRFRKKDLMNLLSINNSENKMSNFTEFRRFNNIPQIVNISTNEGELFLDTNSILCIDILVNIVGKLDENDLVILFENLSQFGYSNVLNTKGKVENEYLFSFVNLNI